MANPRVSTAPFRPPHAPASRELIAAKRREYLALCEIAQDSGQLEKNLRATAGQQALMKEGGAGSAFPAFRIHAETDQLVLALSKAMGNWLVILRTVSLYGAFDLFGHLIGNRALTIG
jgi:hypothetical protein